MTPRTADGYFDSEDTAEAAIRKVEYAPASSEGDQDAFRKATDAKRAMKQLEGSEDSSGTPEKKRARGCYYFMVDEPGFQMVPGQVTHALYMFFGEIIEEGCDGMIGPHADGFAVAMRADWTRSRIPEAVYEFHPGLRVLPEILFGREQVWATIARGPHGEFIRPIHEYSDDLGPKVAR
jgi:hypothetical protein